MARPRLTLDEARNMPFVDLITKAHALIEAYEAPAGDLETEGQRLERLDRSLDELPDIYGWLLQLESYFDHWTDANAEMFGLKSDEYKGMRERRDAMKRAASACKLRYEGTSRVITKILGFDDETRMPRGRG